MTHAAYRPDIDGLRAVAILPVLLGHADIRGFAGGYVGVDVFFVISGYLITGILFRDLEIGRHSISEFYRRRVLRLFPVVFAVLAASAALSCALLLPTELVGFAKSMAAATLFSSNVLFGIESGYFDSASTFKPLLHTWSLAVEEQFYILWPLLLAAVGTHDRRRVTFAIAVVCVLSFAASVVMVRSDPAAAFYLLPTRAWELGIGGLLALVGNPVRARWANEAMGALGLLAILAAIVLYDTATVFPGPAALLPCVGTVMILAAGVHGSRTSSLLSIRPAVAIGLISYSLYMWHWPIIVFTKIYFLELVLDPALQVGVLAASFAVAMLSYRFVERPFRRDVRHWRTRRVLLGGAAAIAVLLGVAAAIYASRGLPERYSPDQQTIAAYLNRDVERQFGRGTCFLVDSGATLDPSCLRPDGSNPTVLLAGDSHAAHLSPGLAHLAGNRYDILQATIAGCRPFLDGDRRSACQDVFGDLFQTWIPENRPSLIVLAARWQEGEADLLARLLASPQMRGRRVVVVGPIPQYTAALPRLLVLAERSSNPNFVSDHRDRTVNSIDREIRQAAEANGAEYISLVELLCQGRTCRTLASPGTPLQFDYGHLTVEGSDIVAQALIDRIDGAVDR